MQRRTTPDYGSEEDGESDLGSSYDEEGQGEKEPAIDLTGKLNVVYDKIMHTMGDTVEDVRFVFKGLWAHSSKPGEVAQEAPPGNSIIYKRCGPPQDDGLLE